MIAAKKTNKKSRKKQTASELLKLDDTSESEVALDSLGHFFNNLIYNTIIRVTREPAMQSKTR